MKAQFIICIIFLLGLVGVRLLNKEQLQYLWSVLAGSALPAVVLPLNQYDVQCPVKNENNIWTNPINSDDEEFSDLSCYLICKTVKQRIHDFERFPLSNSQKTNIL